ESRIAERQRLGPGEMIVAHPATGTLFRWREILKRLAMQQSRRAAPPTRQLWINAAASLPPGGGIPKTRRRRLGLVGRSIQNSFFRASARQGIRLEHGRRRAARVSFFAVAHALGLLQTALRTSDESAD